jgi:outer membrane lipoprotein-sorting protein
MKYLLLTTVVLALLVSACAAPSAAPAAETAPQGASNEVTVFRSPT